MLHRNFPRFTTNNLATFKIEGMTGEHKHYLNDASQGGLCFNALACIKKGTHLEVSFSGNNSKTQGEITWCKYRDRCNCQLGLTFEERIEQAILKGIVQ